MKTRHKQKGGALLYAMIAAAVVAGTAAVVLDDVTSLSLFGQQSRIRLASERALDVMANSAIGLGYAEGSDGRPTLPASLTLPTGGTIPSGGSQTPSGAWSFNHDGWGTPFGFCNFSSATWSGWSTPLFAITSAGPDRSYQTSCTQILAGARNGDDLVKVVTAGDWRAAATVGKTDTYKAPVATLAELAALTPSRPGEMRLVLESKEVYINPTGLAGASNWKRVSGAGADGVVNGKYIRLDEQGIRKWSDGRVETSCNGYRQHPAGYAFTGDIGDGLYWINPAGTPYGVFCDMTTEAVGRSWYDDLVAYWPLDEAAGTTAYDMTGAHNATLQSSITNGVYGYGRLVSGKNPVSLPEILAANPRQVTIAAWIDPSTLGPADMPFAWNGWDVAADEVAGTTIGFNTADADIVGIQKTSGKQLFVFVFDRQQASGSNYAADERIYVNGVRQTISQLSGGAPIPGNRVWQTDLNIGGWSLDTNTAYYLSNAFFDDIAVWKRALSGAEVMALYNSRRSLGGALTANAGFVQSNGVWNTFSGTPLASCKAYRDGGARENGVYRVLIGAASIDVYCDQIMDGGGWALVAKQTGTNGWYGVTGAVNVSNLTTLATSATTVSKLSDATINAMGYGKLKILGSIGGDPVSGYLAGTCAFAAGAPVVTPGPCATSYTDASLSTVQNSVSSNPSGDGIAIGAQIGGDLVSMGNSQTPYPSIGGDPIDHTLIWVR